MALNSNEEEMWTEEMEANFIDLIKEKEHLWNPQHRFYVNSRLKQCSYKDIGKTLRSKWPEHASLFTNLSAKFSSIKSRYKREWKVKKNRKNDKEEKSIPTWEHYKCLNFLDIIISEEIEQSDNVPENNSDEISQIYENIKSPSIGNATVKMEVDDNIEAEPSHILPDISAPECESTVSNINNVRTDENINETNSLDFRLKQLNSCSSSDCNLLYMKAFETVKEVIQKSNSTPCTCSSDTDSAFGHYIGSVLATIPNSQKKETLKMKIMEMVSKARYSEMSGKYSIVKLEDGIQLVPTCWLTEDESRCYWPNYLNLSKINSLVEKLTKPDKKSWTLHKVLRIFETTYDYKEGLEKMEQWVTDNIARSHSAGHQRKRRRCRKDSSSNESEIDKDQTSNQDSLAKSSTNRSSGRKVPCDSIHVNQTSVSNNSSLPSKKSTKTQDKMQLISNKNDEDFMEVVIQMLNSISRRLKVLEDPMVLYNANSAQLDPAVLSDIMKIFPISTDEQMDNLEIFLSEDENEKLMIAALKVIGGSGDDQLITNVLKRCISDGVGELYSWLGAKQKKAFKSLKFSAVIFQCVRRHSQTVTEDKFASVVSNWLRHAKQRRERQDMNLKSLLTAEMC